MESEKELEEMTDMYLRDIALNFMFAGKDSSGTTFLWFFYMLCKNPLIQEKVAQEVRDVVGLNHKANIDEFVAYLTDAALEKMHYIHAALTETLRLYPAVPVVMECSTWPIYAMGRMPYIWGEYAEDFRPERWLQNGIFLPESSFKFVSLHAGPRICIGKDFAYGQMKIVSMTLLCYFRFKLVDETKIATYRTMFTLHMDGGLPMRAIPRTT
ncbi:putative abieta-7,13-dien-18-ol hydroxylase [Rosa chinensis]|uniref:Putative abieta-7,13-dien-18-ol hydroxylase n=1 Tax=Rosa chinensis TaxID=74649 RepID=A0A2P6SGC5_ROSCH|nr:putative abieta-7,13-dien-18-ol hydroxylase [Rosa chinensis]